MRSLTVAGLLVLSVLGGCAVMPGAYGPGPLRAGDASGAVRARMGAPTEQIRRADGTERWVYARGPLGRHTWMVDVGTDGRVTQLYQALEPARFATVARGTTEAEVRSLLGPPSEQRRLAIEQRRLLSWRYETFDCQLFTVTLNRIGQVIDAGYIPDPMCDVDTE